MVAVTSGIVLDGLVDAKSVEGVDVEGYSDDDDVVVGSVVEWAKEEFSLVVADDKVLFPSLYNLK